MLNANVVAHIELFLQDKVWTMVWRKTVIEWMKIRVFHLPRVSPILLLKILKLCLSIKLTEMKKNWILSFLS